MDIAGWEGVPINGVDVGAAARAEARERVARLRAQEAAKSQERAQARRRPRTASRRPLGVTTATEGTGAGWAALWRAVRAVGDEEP